MRARVATLTHALLFAAEQMGSVARVDQELQEAEAALAQFTWFFQNPEIKVTEQTGALQDVFGSHFDPLSVQFLCLLAEKRSFRFLPDIVQTFVALAEKSLGKVVVRLAIPYQPDEALLAKIREVLALRGLIPAAQKETAEIVVNTDESLIGGFAAEYGGMVLDMSLKTLFQAPARSWFF